MVRDMGKGEMGPGLLAKNQTLIGLKMSIFYEGSFPLKGKKKSRSCVKDTFTQLMLHHPHTDIYDVLIKHLVLPKDSLTQRPKRVGAY